MIISPDECPKCHHFTMPHNCFASTYMTLFKDIRNEIRYCFCKKCGKIYKNYYRNSNEPGFEYDVWLDPGETDFSRKWATFPLEEYEQIKDDVERARIMLSLET